MTEAYFAAAARGDFHSINALPRAEQAGKILSALLVEQKISSGSIQELHWIGGEVEFWLSGLEKENNALARFYWPAAPLLAHQVLHNAIRAIEAGERELIVLAHESANEAVMLLIASRGFVERERLTARARFGRRAAVSSRQAGAVASLRAAMEKDGQDIQALRLVAAGREPAGIQAALPNARWLKVDQRGDLFLLDAVTAKLEAGQAGLLISEGPLKSALATIVERV